MGARDPRLRRGTEPGPDRRPGKAPARGTGRPGPGGPRLPRHRHRLDRSQPGPGELRGGRQPGRQPHLLLQVRRGHRGPGHGH
ncbi:MAG: hypothetical protein L6E13_06665 [Firmicutes bacterium]|nr:hypothetical protein [Bacillota bacterium]